MQDTDCKSNSEKALAAHNIGRLLKFKIGEFDEGKTQKKGKLGKR